MIRLPLVSLGLAVALSACGAEVKNGVDVGQVKSLHRGEMSAIDTYDAALAKTNDAPRKAELTKIRDAHKESAAKLHSRVTTLGGSPDATPGVWGDWTKLLTNAAATWTDDAALRTLQAGEQHGVNDYERALDAKDIDETSKKLIRDELLPRQREHVATLKALQK